MAVCYFCNLQLNVMVEKNIYLQKLCTIFRTSVVVHVKIYLCWSLNITLPTLPGNEYLSAVNGLSGS